MDVLSPHPIPVGILYWNAPTRRATIIAKMTLVPKNGHLVLADEQEPLRTAIPSSFGASDELHDPGDFVPYKPRCDVLFVGSARSRTPTRVIPFQFKIGKLERGVYAHAGQPTQSIPLSRVYLRDKPTDDANPVHVGPVSMLHPDRARFLDARLPTHPSAFESTILPAMFDGRSLNAAPQEQQIDPLMPGINFTVPWGGGDKPATTYWIPPSKPRIFLLDDTVPSGLREIATSCDTLLVDMDRERCVLTFRGMLAADRENRFPGNIVVVVASALDSLMPGAAAAIRARATTRRVTEVRDLEDSGDDVMELGDDALELEAESEPLPTNLAVRNTLENAAPQRSSVFPTAPSSGPSFGPAPSAPQSAPATNLVRASTLPFVSAQATAPSDQRSRSMYDDDESTRMHPSASVRASGLPFVQAPASAPVSTPASALNENRTRQKLDSKYDGDENTQMHPVAPARASGLPFVQAPASVPASASHSVLNETRSRRSFDSKYDDDESTQMHPVAPVRASGLPFVQAFAAAPSDSVSAPGDNRPRPPFDSNYDEQSLRNQAAPPPRASTLPFVSAPVDDDVAAAVPERQSVLPFLPAASAPATPHPPRHGGLPFVAAQSAEMPQNNGGLPFVSPGRSIGRDTPSAPPQTSGLPFVSAYPPNEGWSERLGANNFTLGQGSVGRDDPATNMPDRPSSVPMVPMEARPGPSLGPSFVLAIPGQSPETAAIQVLPDVPLQTSLSVEVFAEIKMHVWSGATLREALALHGIDQRTYRIFERRHASELADEAKQGNLERTRALSFALQRARQTLRPTQTDDLSL